MTEHLHLAWGTSPEEASIDFSFNLGFALYSLSPSGHLPSNQGEQGMRDQRQAKRMQRRNLVNGMGYGPCWHRGRT
jgi:hypothetical protein